MGQQGQGGAQDRGPVAHSQGVLAQKTQGALMPQKAVALPLGCCGHSWAGLSLRAGPGQLLEGRNPRAAAYELCDLGQVSNLLKPQFSGL